MKKYLFLFLLFLISCTVKNPVKTNEKNNTPYIVFLFDNASKNTYDLALPVLENHNINATVGIVTGKIGKNGFMNWEQLTDLQNNHFWEIASQSYHGNDLENINNSELIQEILTSKDSLQAHSLNINSFVVPNGNISVRQEAIIRDYYSNIIISGTNNLNASPILRYKLWSYAIRRNYSTNDIVNRINIAKNGNEKVVIFHIFNVTNNPKSELDITPEKLNSILTVLESSDIKCLNLNETLDKILGDNYYAKER